MQFWATPESNGKTKFDYLYIFDGIEFKGAFVVTSVSFTSIYVCLYIIFPQVTFLVRFSQNVVQIVLFENMEFRFVNRQNQFTGNHLLGGVSSQKWFLCSEKCIYDTNIFGRPYKLLRYGIVHAITNFNRNYITNTVCFTYSLTPYFGDPP